MFLHAGELEFAHPLSGEALKCMRRFREICRRFLDSWEADALSPAGVRLGRNGLMDSAARSSRVIQAACRDPRLPVPDEARA